MFFGLFNNKKVEDKKKEGFYKTGDAWIHGESVSGKSPWTMIMTRNPKSSDTNYEPWTFWVVRNNKGYPIRYYYYHYDKQKKESYWIRLHKRKKHEKRI